MPKQTYEYEGKPVTGESIKVTAASEPWAEFTLVDGTTVKAKLILLDAIRLDAFTPTGEPVYQFQLQHIVGVTAAPGLKRQTLPAKPVQ